MIRIKEAVYWLDRKFRNYKILEGPEVAGIHKERIENRIPFLAGKIGGNELWAMRTAEFGYWNKLDLLWKHMTEEAGFFYDGDRREGIERFTAEMGEAVKELDQAVEWQKPKEYYFFKKYMGRMPELVMWNNLDSRLLKGKKVLVIHPFKASIEYQYSRREMVFKDPEQLPEMDLTVLKAVQTIGGVADPRFKNWFEALDYMTEEALARDFDIALVGCGAYGLPLGARLKKAGKTVFHLGGNLQIIFGIIGKRWEVGDMFKGIRTDAWIRPLKEDIPENFEKVEGGCYW